MAALPGLDINLPEGVRPLFFKTYKEKWGSARIVVLPDLTAYVKIAVPVRLSDRAYWAQFRVILEAGRLAEDVHALANPEWILKLPKRIENAGLSMFGDTRCYGWVTKAKKGHTVRVKSIFGFR